MDDVNENMQSLNRHLLALEQSSASPSILNELFRAVHSLKASAQTMGFSHMAGLAHEMENYIISLQENQNVLDGHTYDLLFRCLDIFENHIQHILDKGEESGADFSELIAEMSAWQNKHDPPATGGADSGADDEDAEILRLALREAFIAGKHVYKIKVTISDECIMKAVRAFVIIQALKKHGAIVCSIPGEQDIEEERFDSDFTAAVQSDAGEEALRGVIAGFSDIKHFDVTELYISDLQDMRKSCEAGKQGHTEQAAPGNTPHAGPDVNQIGLAGNENAKGREPQTAGPGGARPAKTEASRQVEFAGRTVRVDSNRLDALEDNVAELGGNINDFFGMLKKPLAKPLEDSAARLINSAAGVENAVYVLNTTPLSDALARLPLICADLTDELGKQAEFIMNVGDTRCNINIVTGLTQSLTHILRNCVDHGIEPPGIRAAAGKARVGMVRLGACYEGGELIIEVEDDGAGVDIGKTRKKAVSLGILSEAEAAAMHGDDVMQLIFLPMFTTREHVTLYSGRGVGMDVVKAKTEEIGGSVVIKSEEGRGTKIILRFPRFRNKNVFGEEHINGGAGTGAYGRG